MTEALRQANDLEVGPLYRQLALLWIRENPGEFVKLLGKKFQNAFGLRPRAALLEGDPRSRWVHVISYGSLLPFMILGLVLSLRQWRRSMILYLAVASYGVTVLVYYGTPRFTVIVVPYLLIFAGSALIAAFDVLKRWGVRKGRNVPQVPQE